MDLTNLIGIYKEIVNVLVWIAILVFLIRSKGFSEKIHFLIVIAGFFLLSTFLGFYYATFFVMAWLVLNNRQLMISKPTALILLVIAFFVPLSSILFYLISLTIYIILIFGFIYYALFPKNGQN